METIDKNLLIRFFQKADERTRGEFVLLGGSVLQLLGITDRTTIDIDISHRDINKADSQIVQLMEVALELNLPVESINQAASFYLYKLDGWQNHIVEVFSGERCRFFRTDATLFVQLKLGRLSEVDLADCIDMIKFAKSSGELLDRKKIEDYIHSKQFLDRSDGYVSRVKTVMKSLGIGRRQ